MHSQSLAGRVAVISGAGRGLGREYALLMASMGAAVVVNDLAGAPGVAEEVIALGGRAVAHEGDIATWGGAREMIQLAVDTFGQLDILVNNAALLRVVPAREMTENDWEQLLAANLMTTVAPIHAAIAHWNQRVLAGETDLGGSIINTTSENALAAYPGRPAYTTGKAGVAALTLGLAQELESIGVRVNCICPRARTPMSQQQQYVIDMMRKPDDPTALDRFDPKEVAPLVAYLAQPGCPVNGTVLRVFGGSVIRFDGWRRGPELTTDQPWTVEDLEQRLGQILEDRPEGGDAGLRAMARTVLS